jgi:protease-4
VFVSIGGMAASGGYYIACAGEQIYATPSSIVGSIGVVGGKFVMSGLYDWAGLGVHRRSRGPLGDMFNTVEPFTPDQRKSLQAAFDRVYDQFTDRVTTGRGKRIADLPTVAQGRIFSGQVAVKNGLVDKVGSLEDCIKDLAKQAKLEPGKYDIVNLPEPLSLPEYLSNLLGVEARAPNMQLTAAQAAALRAAEMTLGPAVVRQLRSHLSGLLLLRHEHVLMLMPDAIVVK